MKRAQHAESQSPLALEQAEPGIQALVSAVRGDEPTLLATRIAAAVSSGQDIARQASYHELASLLFLRLQEMDLLTLLDATCRERLQQAHFVTVTRQTRMLTLWLEIQRILDDAGVRRFLPMKGLAATVTWWPEYIPREMTDLDLVVSADEISSAIKALEAAGFVRSEADMPAILQPHHAPPLRRDGVDVEVHWALWWRHSLLVQPPPSVDDLLRRAHDKTVLDTKVVLPSPEDIMIMQVTDLVRHAFCSPLRPWAGIYWLIQHAASTPDWVLLRSLSEELGLQGLVYAVVRFSSDLCGCGNPTADWADDVTEQAYDKLAPILWRRLVTASHAARAPVALNAAVKWWVARGRYHPETVAWPCPPRLCTDCPRSSARARVTRWRRIVARLGRLLVRLLRRPRCLLTLREELPLMRGLWRLSSTGVEGQRRLNETPRD